MSDAQVIVRYENSLIEIEGQSVVVRDREIISVVSEGVQGPAGASGAGFVHTQASASAEWVINHNLGFQPAVGVFDSGSREVDAEVVHMSVNQTRIYFSMAIAGFARCV